MKSIGIHRATQMAMQAAPSMGLDPNKARPHIMIIAEKLGPTNQSYVLNLERKAQKDILKWSRGLEERDSFIGIAHALGLAKVPIIGGVEYQEAAQLTFAPDAALFSTAAGSAILSEAQALQAIFYGTHTVKTNQGVRIDRNSNFLFQTSQTTQHSGSTVNERNGSELKEIGAAIRFAGGDDNSVSIDFECADKTHIGGAVASGAGHANYLVYFMVGAIIKGGTTAAFLKK